MAKQTISFTPRIVDLVLYAGDGPNFRLVVTTPAGGIVNLTGTMRAQIRSERTAPDPPEATFEIDMSQAANGIAVLKLTGDQTQDLVPTETQFIGVWDLEWTPEDTEPVTLCQGKVECNPDVTR